MKRLLTCGFVAVIAVAPLAAQRPAVKLPPRPEPGPAKTYMYPAVTIDTLPNGLRFAVVENHELPLVSVRTAIAGAGPVSVSYLDPAGKPGAWALMLASLREGTTLRSNTQIRDEVADLGVDMFNPIAVAFSPPWFNAPRSRWTAALDVVGDMLSNPTLSAEGVARAQTAAATGMDRIPSISVVTRVSLTALYGADSPNTRFSSAASIRAVTRDDVVEMRDKYLRPQNTTVVIVGDVTVAQARAALIKAFGGWQRGGITVTPTAITVPSPPPTTIYLKDSPGLAQTYISAALMLPGRDQPDATAASALAFVVGDARVSAGSRLYNAFRVERGLSYAMGVNQITRPIPEPSPFMATLTVAPASTDTAVLLLHRIIGELRSEKPATANELEFARQVSIGRIPMDMERLDAVAFTVQTAILDRLPRDYLNKSVERLNAVTLAEVQAAAAKYIDPAHIALVVVGDKAKIEAGLRATGIPVVIVP